MLSVVAPPWAQRLPLKWQTSARPLAALRQNYADFGAPGRGRSTVIILQISIEIAAAEIKSRRRPMREPAAGFGG
jgi:hypothetical protein